MILFFMLGAIIGWLLVTSVNEDHSEFEDLKRKIKECPPFEGHHDWTYHPVTHRLTCTKCGFVAGT
jgi:hypothetical protein